MARDNFAIRRCKRGGTGVDRNPCCQRQSETDICCIDVPWNDSELETFTTSAYSSGHAVGRISYVENVYDDDSMRFQQQPRDSLRVTGAPLTREEAASVRTGDRAPNQIAALAG